MGPNDLWYIISILKIPQTPSQSFLAFFFLPPRKNIKDLQRQKLTPMFTSLSMSQDKEVT